MQEKLGPLIYVQAPKCQVRPDFTLRLSLLGLGFKLNY